MQIGIYLGATKIESVLLDDNGSEHLRNLKDSPKNYKETIASITESVNLIEKKFNKKFNVGICHPKELTQFLLLLNLFQFASVFTNSINFF